TFFNMAGTAVSMAATAYGIPIGGAASIAGKISVAALAYFLKEEARIEYQDIPFARVEKFTSPGTSFNKNEHSVPEKGIYTISYSPAKAGWGEVKIFAEK